MYTGNLAGCVPSRRRGPFVSSPRACANSAPCLRLSAQINNNASTSAHPTQLWREACVKGQGAAAGRRTSSDTSPDAAPARTGKLFG
ncbi:hypothetical protein EVAR_55264_1 [Eumeta japonica]|uniref:Uncharacterized protein n=1 Tax=Eumeta variegata TaxID=151549 RepID=A0A4C1Z0X1_EUMVA|nr:hypothetical protein EVAR_55264_1 [Eumeta japonica]